MRSIYPSGLCLSDLELLTLSARDRQFDKNRIGKL